MKNRSKIDPEGVPGRPLGMSGLVLEAPGAWSRHFLRKEWKLIKIWTAFYWSRGRPGDPVGPQKSTKNAPGPENGRSETVLGTIFYRLLPRSPFFSLVSSILARFCLKKGWKKLACLSRTARFFQTCDPHETLRMAVKIDVLTFCVFAVFVEKTTKNESKISALATSPQNLQKVPSGTPFWDPKRTRINFEISKSVPNTKKKRFLAPPGTKPKKGQKKTLEP